MASSLQEVALQWKHFLHVHKAGRLQNAFDVWSAIQDLSSGLKCTNKWMLAFLGG